MNNPDIATLESLFDHLPDVAFFIKDAAGRYRVVNESLMERCGLSSRNEVLGKHARELFPTELAKSYSAQDEKVLKTGRPILDHLELHWHAQRKPGWCLTTKLPLKNASGKVTGLVGISRDVRAPENRDTIPAGLTKALEFLESNYVETISPSSLAKIAELPPVRFARLIRKIYRLTPVQLIAKTRLANASRLLRETDRTVIEIALASGYYDHSAFTRAFKSATGVTPTQFRQTGISRAKESSAVSPKFPAQ